MAQLREKCGKQPTKKLMKLYWEWFVDARSRNLRISEPILQSKDIAEKLGKTDFHASNGWLESFRKRHGISFKAVCSEAGDVSDETVNTWLKKIEKLIEGYEPQIIANADEIEVLLFTRGSAPCSLKLANPQEDCIAILWGLLGNPAGLARYNEDTACPSTVVPKSLYTYYTCCSVRSPASKDHVVILAGSL
ncbi:hypothetical protein AVEN_232586-1 [Araneus ventricosus]|uniref:HTH CENPB-type domain-containing protein n=1 Tax=Araneus ventricosus TaxID=182803 RepID=A0A4Y2M7N4_ARAVE|nr:hypothetical protein AVEN_232586-1 [Araneus ventricosus]